MVDVIVIGGGHAGVEAALACARLKKTTILYSMHIDMIASSPSRSSNPLTVDFGVNRTLAR